MEPTATIKIVPDWSRSYDPKTGNFTDPALDPEARAREANEIANAAVNTRHIPHNGGMADLQGRRYATVKFEGLDENGLALVRMGGENAPRTAVDVGACRFSEAQRASVNEVFSGQTLAMEPGRGQGDIRLWNVDQSGNAQRIVPAAFNVRSPWDYDHPDKWAPKDAAWLDKAPDDWLEYTRKEEDKEAAWLRDRAEQNPQWFAELRRVQLDRLGPVQSMKLANSEESLAASWETAEAEDQPAPADPEPEKEEKEPEQTYTPFKM